MTGQLIPDSFIEEKQMENKSWRFCENIHVVIEKDLKTW